MVPQDWVQLELRTGALRCVTAHPWMILRHQQDLWAGARPVYIALTSAINQAAGRHSTQLTVHFYHYSWSLLTKKGRKAFQEKTDVTLRRKFCIFPKGRCHM